MYEINATTRLKLTAAGRGDEWWNSLSPKQQKEYIKLHPKSKYAKGAGKGVSKLAPATKTPSKPAAVKPSTPAPAPSEPMSEQSKERVKRGLMHIPSEERDYLIEDFNKISKIDEQLKTAKGSERQELMKKRKSVSFALRDQADAVGIDLKKNPDHLKDFVQILKEDQQRRRS
jgi:hypothetical protein